VSRHPVRVRPAAEPDLPALLALGEELREQLMPGEGIGRGSPCNGQRPALEQRYRDALADEGRHVLLAVSGEGTQEEVLGMALLSVSGTNALLDLPAVHVTHVVVADKQRRRGAGRALVAAAAAFAEERGLEQIVVAAAPSSRDAARFFARLGFAPVSVRRTAPVSVVRRRLALAEGLTEPLGRRRVLRAAGAVRGTARPRHL
jgi:ribosomal protein S18 acetylase RimI-like enzyme